MVSHELVSLASASTLAVLRREQKDRKPAAKVLAVLADPVFARDDERVKIKLNERSSANSKQEDRITQTPQASGKRATQANEPRQTTETYGSRQLLKEQLAKSAQESNAQTLNCASPGCHSHAARRRRL